LAKVDGTIDVGSCDSATAAGSDDVRWIDLMLAQSLAHYGRQSRNLV
jgi:hypothetical protein